MNIVSVVFISVGMFLIGWSLGVACCLIYAVRDRSRR